MNKFKSKITYITLSLTRSPPSCWLFGINISLFELFRVCTSTSARGWPSLSASDQNGLHLVQWKSWGRVDSPQRSKFKQNGTWGQTRTEPSLWFYGLIWKLNHEIKQKLIPRLSCPPAARRFRTWFELTVNNNCQQRAKLNGVLVNFSLIIHHLTWSLTSPLVDRTNCYSNGTSEKREEIFFSSCFDLFKVKWAAGDDARYWRQPKNIIGETLDEPRDESVVFVGVHGSGNIRKSKHWDL